MCGTYVRIYPQSDNRNSPSSSSSLVKSLAPEEQRGRNEADQDKTGYRLCLTAAFIAAVINGRERASR